MNNPDDLDRAQTKGPGGGVVRTVPTHAAGLGEVFTDPLWRVAVELRPVESRLLRTVPLRRLHFVAHGGASTISTLQSYSRLEHTLGVLALVVHFRPEDEPLRVAALLHDIGHLPLSHTFEGVAGLNHHAIGLELLAADPVRSVLREYGVDAAAVGAVLAGEVASPLTNRAGLLSLDHLDSYVRSGRAAGRLDVDPAALLGRLGLVEDAVSTDRETAATLVDLVGAEAHRHTAWDNVGPTAVVRRLVGQVMDGGAAEPGRLARMADWQLWALLDSWEATRAESTRLRYEPHRLRVVPEGAPAAAAAWGYSLRKIYRSAPLVAGRPLAASAPELAAQLDDLGRLPMRFRVWWA